MKKKNTAKDNLNLFFSAFLILAYVICAYFFVGYANTLDGLKQSVVMTVVFVVFGLLMFYATRVGDGKAVVRFSVITLVLMVLPALYAVVASMVPQLPLHDQLTEIPSITYLAAVALGYGIPYTFLSGFEIVEEPQEEQEEISEETQDTFEISETSEELSEEVVEEAVEEEIVVEGVSEEAETEE